MPHFIFIQQISVLNILNMLYDLNFFSSKCRLFHNVTLFGFCITHILNTGCAKIWKKIRRQKVNIHLLRTTIQTTRYVHFCFTKWLNFCVNSCQLQYKCQYLSKPVPLSTAGYEHSQLLYYIFYSAFSFVGRSVYLLHSFFCVIHRLPNFMCLRFETLSLFHLHRWWSQEE